MKNKYIKVTHISERNTREFIRQTINKFYKAIRQRIAELCEAESLFTNGEIELDESYFGARRVRGIGGRGAKGKPLSLESLNAEIRFTHKLSRGCLLVN